MNPLARPIVPPVVTTVFICKLICFEVTRTDGRHYRQLLWVGLVDQQKRSYHRTINDPFGQPTVPAGSNFYLIFETLGLTYGQPE